MQQDAQYSRFVARFATSNHKASKYMFNILAPIVKKRLQARCSADKKVVEASVLVIGSEACPWLILLAGWLYAMAY